MSPFRFDLNTYVVKWVILINSRKMRYLLETEILK